MANVWNGSTVGGSYYRTWADSETNINYTIWDSLTGASTGPINGLDLSITWNLLDLGTVILLNGEVTYSGLSAATTAAIEFDVQYPVIPSVSFLYSVKASSASDNRFQSGFNSIGTNTNASDVTITHLNPPIGQATGPSQTLTGGSFELMLFGVKI